MMSLREMFAQWWRGDGTGGPDLRWRQGRKMVPRDVAEAGVELAFRAGFRRGLCHARGMGYPEGLEDDEGGRLLTELSEAPRCRRCRGLIPRADAPIRCAIRECPQRRADDGTLLGRPELWKAE